MTALLPPSLGSAGLETAIRPRVGRAGHPFAGTAPIDEATLLGVVESYAAALATNTVDEVPELVRSSLASGKQGPVEPSGERWFRRLLATPAVEVWLIAWGRAALLELHDHGASLGAVRVLRGELAETFTDLSSRRPLESRSFVRGEEFSFTVGYVHELWNPFPEVALSLHAYSPRLVEMNFYRLDEAEDLQLVRTERYPSLGNRSRAPSRVLPSPTES